MTDRTIAVVYCDDIRNEIGNKQSWMGIYSGDLVVQQMPSLLPKLCLAVTISSPADRPLQRLRLYAKRGDDLVFEINADDQILQSFRLAESGDADTGPNDGIPRRRVLILATAISPFVIDRDSTLRVFAETEVEGERLTGRGLRIRLGTPAELGTQVQPPVPT
jgi:hypothetical protein